MVKRAFELKVPFKFFLYNDLEDFERFMDFMTTRVMGHANWEVYDWEPRGEEYAAYGTDLNEFFDMPDNVGGYMSEEPDVWLLRFNVMVKNDMKSG